MSDAPESQFDNVFEKSDTVFFAVKPDGVMLHNHAAGAFMDLDKGEEFLWKYCDGTISLSEAIDRALQTWPPSAARSAERDSLRDLAAQLVRGGFLRIRE